MLFRLHICNKFAYFIENFKKIHLIMFSKDVYVERRARLMRMVGSGLIILPGNVELPFNYPGNTFPFRQDSNFLYYIGVDIPGMAAVINCDTGEEVLFGHNATIDDIIWTGPVPTVEEWGLSTGISDCRSMDALARYVAETNSPCIHYIKPYQAEVAQMLSQILGLPVSALQEKQSTVLIDSVVMMRKIKSQAEINEMEKATDATSEMHCGAMRLVGKAAANNIAISERDVMAQLSKVALQKGYYHSFPPIVTVHGEIFHGHAYSQPLHKGALLVMDAGAESQEHYAGDMTRTIPVGGKFSKRQKDVYDIVAKANMGVIQSARPGISWRDMHNRAARIIASGLKDLGLMRGDTDDIVATGAYALFFPHGLGHLVGLDVHDMDPMGEDHVGYNEQVRRSDTFGPCNLRYALELEKDMVITDEPGIYFIPQLIDMWRGEGRFADFINYDRVDKYKGFGGIRIEDDLLITDQGCRVLGVPVPKSSAEVEEYMARWQ